MNETLHHAQPDNGSEEPALPVPRRPDNLLELRVRDLGTARSLRGVGRHHETVLRLQAREAETLPLRDLGDTAIDDVRTFHAQAADVVHRDLLRGAVVHRRLPGAVRALPLLVLGLDLAVVYTFCADLFNVPALELSIDGISAIGLAALAGVVSYTWLSTTGTRLRDFRNGLGEIEWHATGALTRFQIGVALVITTALAVLMYERVVDKASLAGELYIPVEQVGVLGWIFAILCACANLTVVVVHTLDGSHEAELMRQSGRGIRHHQIRMRWHRFWARRAMRALPSTHPLSIAIPPADRD